jgi:ribosomal protein RSM22 (predicted rRNA methylase)
MPSSTYLVLNEAVKHILKINPRSVLDVGIGFGKYGFLVREYIECWQDRVLPEQWAVELEGVEIFKPYTEIPHNQSIYDKIHVGNASDVCFNLFDIKSYDLIICMDVIEHMDKDNGMNLAESMIENCTKGCIINVPTGNWLNNKVVANNPAEEHQAIWETKDLQQLSLLTGTPLIKYEWQQNGRTGCMGVFRK